MVLLELLNDEPKSRDVIRGGVGRHETSLLRALSRSPVLMTLQIGAWRIGKNVIILVICADDMVKVRCSRGPIK